MCVFVTCILGYTCPKLILSICLTFQPLLIEPFLLTLNIEDEKAYKSETVAKVSPGYTVYLGN